MVLVPDLFRLVADLGSMYKRIYIDRGFPIHLSNTDKSTSWGLVNDNTI